MKYDVDGLNSRLGMMKERLSELENMAVDISQSEKQIEKLI